MALNLSNRLFHFSLLFSLGIHITLFLIFSINNHSPELKPLKQIEVVYESVKIKEQPAPAKKVDHQAQSTKPSRTANDIDMITKKSDFFELDRKAGFEPSDSAKTSKLAHLERKKAPKVPLVDIQRKVSVPLLQTEKMSNPRYLTYNEFVREKIREKAYSFINHPDFRNGRVYLTFILASNGHVKQAQIIEDRTQANSYLRSVGMRSINEADPFPPFPKDLDYPELSFNVVISFELEQ